MLRKVATKANEEKVKNFSRMNDGNGRSTLEGVEMQRILKEYFEDLYNIDTQEQVAVHMCGFEGFRRDNCFGGDPLGEPKLR